MNRPQRNVGAGNLSGPNQQALEERHRARLLKALDVMERLRDRLAARKDEQGHELSPDELQALARRLNDLDESRADTRAQLANVEKRIEKLKRMGGGRQLSAELAEALAEQDARHQYRIQRIDALFEDVKMLRAQGADDDYLQRYMAGRESILFPERAEMLPASPPIPRIIRFHRWFRTSFTRRSGP